MKIPFLKKKQTRPNSSFKKYDSIARQRKRTLASEKFKSFSPAIKFPKKLLIIPLVLVLVIVIIILFTSSNFKVKQVYVIGDDEKESLILQDLDSFKGRNIFLIKSSDIVASIKAKYENVENVFVYKSIPDKIEIEIVKSLPSLVFSSFQKTTLVKKDGSSLGDITSLGSLKLLDYETKILNGEKDLAATYIKDAFLADLPDDQRKSFKFEEVKPEDREAKYNQIKDAINTKINQYRDSIKEFLKSSDYSTLPFFFSYIAYEDNPTIFETALEVSDGLKLRDISPVNNIFTSQYTLEEDMESGKQILFSTKRLINEQFLDLDSIISTGRYSGARIMDLRSEKYSIIQ